MIALILTTIALCVETIPTFQATEIQNLNVFLETWTNSSFDGNVTLVVNETTNEIIEEQTAPSPSLGERFVPLMRQILLTTQIVTNIWFAFEITVRVITCPNKVRLQ